MSAYKSNPFKDDGESDITNAYPEAILTKYEHTLMMFETLYSDDEKIEYYRRQLGALKKQKMRGKYLRLVLGIVVFVLILLFFATMAYLQNNGYID